MVGSRPVLGPERARRHEAGSHLGSHQIPVRRIREGQVSDGRLRWAAPMQGLRAATQHPGGVRTQPVWWEGLLDISLVDGFNVPMDFSPTCNGCTRGIKCTANINGQCPSQLSAPGGCNNPCTVLKTDQYCCNSGRCAATDFSRFFKSQCPDAYSYLKDD
ncbi:hypothetical protein CDL15_Pgr000411 [Punica granatum]|uniref:Thaumatin-like protein n=1 Tax=Punica granatum TaxID=22663 RepID=A0A218XSS9_PUNGR|nr:hypothetical protein CDL15_Pgr000411 [Punica granatum]